MVFVPSITPEGRETRRAAKALIMSIAQNFAAKTGIDLEVHEITPTYIQTTATKYGCTGLQMPRIYDETVDDQCAIAVCGFWNNDPHDALVLRFSKGREFVTDLMIRSIYDFGGGGTGGEGVDGGFGAWGVRKEGENLTWQFLYTTEDYIDCFPIGYITCPQGKVDIMSSVSGGP